MVDHIKDFLGHFWKPGDTNEHFPVLLSLATQCEIIVEFGVRGGGSTKAFLAGQSIRPDRSYLYSFDIEDCTEAAQAPDSQTHWVFSQKDTSKLFTIPECDMLFIDTLHTHDQVTAELRHGNKARRWIVFHDTVLFGDQGEIGQPGIRIAIDTFRHRNPYWRICYEYRHNNGLLILEKDEITS